MNNCCVGARVHINFLVVQVHKFYALKTLNSSLSLSLAHGQLKLLIYSCA